MVSPNSLAALMGSESFGQGIGGNGPPIEGGSYTGIGNYDGGGGPGIGMNGGKMSGVGGMGTEGWRF